MISIANKIIVSLFFCLLLFGCRQHDSKKSVEQYIAEIKKQKVEPINPLPHFLKAFENPIDSADNSQLSLKEPVKTQCRLTAYSADAFSVEGVLINNAKRWLIVQANNSEYYKVPDDSFIGKECTSVLKISNQLFDAHRKALSGKGATLILNKVPLKNVLLWLAECAQINVIISPEIKGDITMQIKNVSWRHVLSVLLQSENLEKKQAGNVVYINKRANNKGSSNVLNSTTDQQTFLQPLKYANVNEVIKIITDQKQSLLSPSGHVSCDVRTNAIFIHDHVTQANQILKFIKQLDVPVPQVLIKAKLVNIDDDYEKDLGLRFNLKNRHLFDNASSKEVKGAQEDMVSLAQNNGGFGMALAKLAKGTILDLELSVLENEGKAEIVSSPSLLTTNQQPAKIEAGEEIPYQESVSEGVTATAFKKAVLSLKVTPQILPNHQLILHLEVNQDKRSSQEVKGVPAIDTRHVSTEVLVNDGQTVVLGGIYEHTQTHREERVPFFSDLPIIGVLFRHNKTVNNRRELLIFVTPKIIYSK